MATTTVAAQPSTVAAVSGDGTRITAFVAGRGPPLVLVHGTTADHTRWDGILTKLAERHTVYAMDRRGRGASGDHPSYAVEREFEDVAAIVDLAALRAGGPVDVLGHSYGGLCALGAATRTSKIRRLVLYEPPHEMGTTYLPGFLEGLDTLVASGNRDEALRRFFTDVVGVPAEQLQRLRQTPMWERRVQAAHTITRECRAEHPSPLREDVVSGIRLPVLLLEGDASPTFLRQSVQALRRILPNSRVATMPGQQHMAMDTAPDLFLREVEGFITT